MSDYPEEVNLPSLLHRAQQTAAIDAIEEYTAAITTEGVENYLQIHHRLIKNLEDDTTTSTK